MATEYKLSYTGREIDERLTRVEKTVCFTEQTLTEEQQEQARANIEVASFKHNNPNIRAINHRGYNTAAPENTLSAFRLSKQMGYKYVECDVCFTSDGVPVLLHDSTVDRTSDGTGSIAEMNYEEVRALDFGSWFSAEYAGEKIPALAEFIILCKQNGLRPYIEIKGGVTAKQAKTLVGIVKRYDMRKNVTWISFSSSSLEQIKTIDNQARLGFVVDAVSENTITTATGLKTDKNEVFIDAYHGGVTNGVITLCVENEIPLEVWTVNTEAKLLAIDPYVSGYTSDNLRANIVLYGADIPEYIPEAPSVRSALINVDFANSGINIGTGGSAYNAAIGNGGAYSGGKFVVNGKGYLSVPAEFMGVSATNPWSIAFKIDSATKSKNTWNRFARGNNDIPAMYAAGSSDANIHAVQFKAASNFNEGYVWKDDSIINAQGAAYNDSDYSNVFPMVVGFRNDGTYVSLWINGAMVATQLSAKYKAMATSFQIGDGGLQNYDPGSLECSMLKLWNEALTDEEMAAATLLQ